MTDIEARLRSRSPYLRDSAAERDMEEAANTIERMRAYNKIAHNEIDQMLVERSALKAEIERLRLTPKEAYLQIVEGWLRNNRGIHFPGGAVDDLCKRIARTAPEPKSERRLIDRDEVWDLFCKHYWDSFQKDRDLILCHVDAVLQMARAALEPKCP
jgi:hypothetical protein